MCTQWYCTDVRCLERYPVLGRGPINCNCYFPASEYLRFDSSLEKKILWRLNGFLHVVKLPSLRTGFLLCLDSKKSLLRRSPAFSQISYVSHCFCSQTESLFCAWSNLPGSLPVWRWSHSSKAHNGWGRERGCSLSFAHRDRCGTSGGSWAPAGCGD